MFSNELIIIAAACAGVGILFRELYWRAGLVESERKRGGGGARWVFATGLICAGAMLLAGRAWAEETHWTLCFFVAVLTSFSVVDVEEKVIPKHVWWIGFFAVLIAVFITPASVGQTKGMEALKFSLVGGVTGAGLIFLMVESGKMLFGKLVIPLDEPQEYRIEAKDEHWQIVCGEDSISLREVIMRSHDFVIIENEDGSTIRINETTINTGRGEEPIRMTEGVAKQLTIPREAMGFGDVKFMLMAGAMIGWEGSLFAIFAGAVFGSLIGGVLRISGGCREIPFVPFLSAGVLVFLAMPEEVELIFDVMLGRGGAL
jgi:leader peptidase (prepilin peptidase)/N-methyltransferase